MGVDLEAVALAMEICGSENESYLDTETGEVVVIPLELLDEHIFAEEYVKDLPKWKQDLVPCARPILRGSDRYAVIPTAPSYEEYNLMLEFAASISDPNLRDLLSVALNGTGAPRRFKHILQDYPKEAARWFQMRDEFSIGRVREWLRELDIEPLDDEIPRHSDRRPV